MKILITGINGFAGSHLAEFLLKREDEVCGIVKPDTDLLNIEHIKSSLRLFDCDINDAERIKEIIISVQPEKIFHLAAQSFVPASWESPAATITTNIVGQINIFEAVRQAGVDPVIQIACSSDEYGSVNENEMPITEETPLRPLNPYAISKVAQDFLGYQYFRNYGLKIIRTRSFNHTGPRRGEGLVCSNFAHQIALIEKGEQPPQIKVGNLQARRDFTDVRDVVRAYWLATEKCEHGEVYNICSGRTWVIEDVLKKLLALSSAKIEVVQDPARMRPSDMQVLQGDASKFNKQTGWKPEISFEQTLSDLLEYWRERV